MLGMDKKKKDGLAIIIANGIDKKGSEEEYTADSEAAAEEVLAAIEKKDPKALAESLSAMIEICSNSNGEEESEEE